MESSSSRTLAQETFSSNSTGLARVATWIGRRTEGIIGAVLITAEGTGYYEAVMVERLAQQGYRVVEVPTPSANRLRVKGTNR